MANQTGSSQASSSANLVLLLIAALSLAAAGATGYLLQKNADRDAEHLQLAKAQQSLSLEISTNGSEASRGIQPNFRNLEGSQESFRDNLVVLKDGDIDFNIPAVPEDAQPVVDRLSQAWGQMNRSLAIVIDGRSAYQQADGLIRGITDSVPAVAAELSAARDRLVQLNGSTGEIIFLSDQIRALDRLAITAERIISQGRGAAATTETLGQQTLSLVSALTGLQNGQVNGIRVTTDTNLNQSYSLAVEQTDSIAAAVTSLAELANRVNAVQEASAILSRQGVDVLAVANDLEQKLAELQQAQLIKPIYPLAFALLALVALISYVGVLLFTSSRRQSKLETADEAQQQAILRLLDEITNLADGDLTLDVTVTEDFTGAIADSINYTIDTLRNLVGTINTTAVEVASAAVTTEGTAKELSAASQDQSSQIGAASDSVASMSRSMQNVSHEATRLADEAAQSVETAHNGAETVGRTISGMDALREQIQETSKRIKRLGESSQEIGNIVEFINDIAEQTNSLAINAAIQAATAGEAGRGFGVVADEVQRLAERATNATRQIEALVKTIQADTNEAIISMERSTTTVVSGAQSAEEAGQALSRIESHSTELSKLIQGISISAAEQTEVATSVSTRMQDIRGIAENTSLSADETAEAIRHLAVLSDQLRDSISGFKLPD